MSKTDPSFGPSIEAHKEHDMLFLKQFETSSCTPIEYNGFNSKLARDRKAHVYPTTNVWFEPLVNQKPSDPSVNLSVMLLTKKRCESTGQGFTIFVADLQLYNVALDVMFDKSFILVLGGMHLLMNFISCIGNLMESSGLSKVLESTFGSVKKMLSGKLFPQNLRALRFIFEEILRPFIPSVDTYDELIQFLNEKASSSPTCKLWVDLFCKPILLCLIYFAIKFPTSYLVR